MKPFCFVLMPFGVKRGESGGSIDFDSVYRQMLLPAIEQAGLTAVRGDSETVGGIIHRPMFERLNLCEFAVADLTTANANVFYELGVRHAVRPHTTVLVFADDQRLPFDVAPARGLPYQLDSAGRPLHPAAYVELLAAGLTSAREPATDSPIYQLLGDWPEVSHTKTDVFRDRVEYEKTLKDRLVVARSMVRDDEKRDAVKAIEAGLNHLDGVDVGVLVDVLLSYRAASAWEEMVDLIERMPQILAGQVLVREQLGMALNRLGRSAEAEDVLTQLIDDHGRSPETCGILGRVYKDLYRLAFARGEKRLATGLLEKAINAYLEGFETDWRDHYPGINAIQLIAELDPSDPRLEQLIPVVDYAVRRKITDGNADYWDYATVLELAVRGNDQAAAETALGRALADNPENWQRETTAVTLHEISQRGGPEWIQGIEKELRPVRDEGG